MAYIGKTPVVGNFQICDAISVVNGQAAYTLQVGGANVIPESANHMIVSLSGVIQKPGSSYTVSGSTITFSQNLVTGDVIDFIQILGNVLDIGTPSDATVTTAKLGDSAVTTAKITDANVTSAKMFSGFANGITEYDMYRISAHTSDTSDADITSNWERVDDPIYEKIGTGISQSSGIFSFPSTGKYLITAVAQMQCRNGRVGHGRLRFYATQDNSSYTLRGQAGMSGDDANDVNCVIIHVLFDVTNTTNDKVKLNIATTTNNVRALGDSSLNRTFISFLRLGDT